MKRDAADLASAASVPTRNLCGVVVETIQLGLDLLAGEFALVRRGRDHGGVETICTIDDHFNSAVDSITVLIWNSRRHFCAVLAGWS
jgi:hypothetical protein